MKLRYLSLGAVALGFVIGGSASQANADVPGGSGCAGSAVFSESAITAIAETDGGPYTIKRNDTVQWKGSVDGGSTGSYSGSVSVDLPPPFGEVLIEDWSGDYNETSNEGTEEYDLPSLVPAGVEFDVHAEHIDENGGCSATVAFEIDGGPFDSPIAPISLGGTAIFAILTGLALKPLFVKVV